MITAKKPVQIALTEDTHRRLKHLGIELGSYPGDCVSVILNFTEAALKLQGAITPEGLRKVFDDCVRDVQIDRGIRQAATRARLEHMRQTATEIKAERAAAKEPTKNNEAEKED